MRDDTQIEQWRQAIDHSLLGGLENRDGDLAAAIHYALSVKGKRLRPLLFISLIQAHGRDPLPAMDVAVAIEYIHTYSLIHDDLPALDDDDLRRGMPTCHREFGEATAILTGDALLTRAFQILAELPHVADAIRLEILREISRAVGTVNGMIGGQVVDLESEGKPIKSLPRRISIGHPGRPGSGRSPPRRSPSNPSMSRRRRSMAASSADGRVIRIDRL